MTIKSALSTPETLKDAINYAVEGKVSDYLRALAFGDLVLGQMNQVRRSIDMTAQPAAPYNLNTLQAIAMASSNLPPACTIQRATARAGGVTGELTVVAYGTTPTTGQIAVGPNGSIVTLATDAITNLDVNYVAERGIVVELTLAVASGTLTLPSSILTGGVGGNGVVLLLEAEALAGTVTGKKVVLVPGTGPATGQARLSVAKNTVLFNSGTDAVTRARVKMLVALPATDGLIGTLASVPVAM